jgi:hypothetical protein
MALNFPSNPSVGEVYTVNGESWTWDGSRWLSTPASEATYSPVYIGTFAPSDPLPGDLWWDCASGDMYIYYVDENSSQWVSAFQPPNVKVEVTPTQVIEALLNVLPVYPDMATAVANGTPNGGLFQLTGSTTISGIRAVASYTP